MESWVANHWSDWVALITAVLAVFTAFASAEASRNSSLSLMLETQKTDTWAYYQAKSIKAHNYRLQAQLIGLMEPASTASLQKARDEAKKQSEADAEKCEREKSEVEASAKKLGEDRTAADSRGDRDTRSVIALQIAIVLCSVAGITKKSWLLGLGLASGTFGLGCFFLAMLH